MVMEVVPRPGGQVLEGTWDENVRTVGFPGHPRVDVDPFAPRVPSFSDRSRCWLPSRPLGPRAFRVEVTAPERCCSNQARPGGRTPSVELAAGRALDQYVVHGRCH
jgi:hypothetical protein